MSEENAGQGETTPTGNTDSGRLHELEGQLQEATRTIERLRGTQSSNDRELGRLRTREGELQQQLADIDAARSAALSDLTNERSGVELLKKRLGELSVVEESAKVAQSNAERMRLAAIMAGTTPAISLLVETNALPQADTTDAFKEALERIATGIGQVASGQARQMLAGTHPNVPGAKPTRDALLQEADRLLKAGEFEKAITMNTQALELKE
jgi:chromosome segregation ATPase